MNQKQIDQIHLNKRAVEGKIYTGPKNILYYGHPNGHLVQQDLMSGDIIGTTLRSVVARIGDYTVEELTEILESIADMVTREEFEEYKKEAKCFTMAMSIAL